jgi:hypothetical protein
MLRLKALHVSRMQNKRCKDVIGDGNCLYRAISVCMHGKEDYWGALKAASSHLAATNPELLLCVGESTL